MAGFIESEIDAIAEKVADAFIAKSIPGFLAPLVENAINKAIPEIVAQVLAGLGPKLP